MSIEVSVVTPTYNRRQFIPNLIEIYKNQTYPKDKMEWIIVDDGRDKVEDLFVEAAKSIPNIRYIYKDEKMRLGAKRNLLNDEAKGNIIIAMDDDDYYPPNRVKTVVDAFRLNPKVDLAGSSEMMLYYIDTKQIFRFEAFGENHATNGTLAWRKRYANTHRYNDYVTMAEETAFLENYKNKMIQLDSRKTILVLCHSDNTFDKYTIRTQHAALGERSRLHLTEYKLEDIVKEPLVYQFITKL